MSRANLALLLGLALLCLLALSLALGLGSVSIPVEEIWASLWDEASPTVEAMIWQLRWPRALAAFAVGALLALSGTLMQVLLRNPLADPYVLGLSGGAAVATFAATLAGLGLFWLDLAAFLGAGLSTLLVFGLAHGQGSWTPTRLLLTGVVVAAGWGALISFLLAISPDTGLRGMLFWLMGDLAGAQAPLGSLLVLLIGSLIALGMARDLNVLVRGELQAQSLGVNARRLRLGIFALAAACTGTAVALAGSVGFVGLIIPHMLRLLGARDHRVLLPACVLFGGAFLLLADTAARTLLAPHQLPVGVLTALIGVPVFLVLLQRAQIRT